MEKMIKKVITKSDNETRKLASTFISKIKPGTIIGLIGDLGSGKTVFVKGAAKALGIKDLITSPTFNIVQIYLNKKKLYHFDLYRLNCIEDLENIGYEDYFNKDGIIFIEWADKFLEIIPKNNYLIYFQYLDKNKREIKIIKYL